MTDTDTETKMPQTQLELFYAAMYGRLPELERLLNEGVSPDAPAPEKILNEESEILEAADAQEFAGNTTGNLPLKELFARVKQLLKHIRS